MSAYLLAGLATAPRRRLAPPWSLALLWLASGRLLS